MDKAKLSISKSKKGDSIVKVVFDGKKEITVQHTNIQDNLNGKEVEVERDNGHVVKIVMDGKEIFAKKVAVLTVKTSTYQSLNTGYTLGTVNPTAPYNFVPLNKVVIPAEERPDSDRYYVDIDEAKNKYTGYINLNIETETPLYIRGTLTEQEVKDNKESKNKPDFFSPAQSIRIPGSSLRGMTRTLVEIMSYGKFEFFEKNRKYHFRSFADKSLDLRDQYINKIMEGDDNVGYSQKVEAGYLFKDGIHYKVRPAKILPGCDKQFLRIEEADAMTCNILTEKMKNEIYQCQTHKNQRSNNPGNCPICKSGLRKKYVPNRNYKWFDYKPIKFTYAPAKVHNYSKKLRFARVDKAWKENDSSAPNNALNGVLVLSGWIPGQREGKHIHWVVGPRDEDEKNILELMDEVIEDYKNDINRHNNAEIIKRFDENKKAEVPCFYIMEEVIVKEEISENGKKITQNKKVTKVSSFGHTGIFRLAYKKELNYCLPHELQQFNGIDIAEAIFGNEKTFAGRVFFEDAILDKDQRDVLMPKAIPQILSTPKPTSFQHYLEQDISRIQTVDDNGNIRGLKTYNDDTVLRGYKLYWHKTGENWQAKEIIFDKKKFETFLQRKGINKSEFNGYIDEKKGKIHIDLNDLPEKQKNLVIDAIGIYESQYSKIQPINKGKTFTGRIRFENLSKVELGALLSALALPVDCCHKLGMGKPLGLGSVEITPKLHLSDRKTRYTDIFAEWGNDIPKVEELQDFKNAFETYVLDKLEEKGKKSLWEIERMKELEKMLNIKTKPADDSTKYMELNEFKHRNVLPKSTEV